MMRPSMKLLMAKAGSIGASLALALDYQDGRDARAYHRPIGSCAPIDSDLQVKGGCGWDLDKTWSDVKCTLEKSPARKHKMIDVWTTKQQGMADTSLECNSQGH